MLIYAVPRVAVDLMLALAVGALVLIGIACVIAYVVSNRIREDAERD